MHPQFDDDDLARALDALTPAELDALPFGVIGLDKDERVRSLNRAEAEQSGHGARPTVGLAFFEQLAPCMSGDSFRGRITRALVSGSLDIEFGHVGDFSDKDRSIRVRAMSSADGGVWLAHERETP